jgi:hypothetical protein
MFISCIAAVTDLAFIEKVKDDIKKKSGDNRCPLNYFQEYMKVEKNGCRKKNISSFLRSFVPSFLPSFVPSFRPFLPSFLPSFLSSSVLPSFLPSFLPDI